MTSSTSLGCQPTDVAEPIDIVSSPTPSAGVPAVRRAAAILWLLAERSTPLGLTQIARAVEILPSTALQILRELTGAKLIAFDPALKLYRLGSGIVDLAQAAVRYDDFAELARPHLQTISARFDVTATATAMIDDQHTACMVSISPTDGVSLNVTLGGRVPLLAGAVGRCIAAYSEDSIAGLKRRFERIRWQAPLDFELWRQQVEHVRLHGYAEDEGCFALGVTTLAVPIPARDGRVTRAIGIATISATLDSATKQVIADALIEAAADIRAHIAS